MALVPIQKWKSLRGLWRTTRCFSHNPKVPWSGSMARTQLKSYSLSSSPRPYTCQVWYRRVSSKPKRKKLSLALNTTRLSTATVKKVLTLSTRPRRRESGTRTPLTRQNRKKWIICLTSEKTHAKTSWSKTRSRLPHLWLIWTHSEVKRESRYSLSRNQTSPPRLRLCSEWTNVGILILQTTRTSCQWVDRDIPRSSLQD